MSLIDKIKKHFYLPYKDVGDCPKCGSNLTGLYFRENKANAYTMFSHLKYSAELSLPKSDMSDGLNCFCLGCGVSWAGRYTTRWISLKEMDSIKESKNISSEMTEHFRYYKRNQKKAYKETKKIKKKEHRKERIKVWLKK